MVVAQKMWRIIRCLILYHLLGYYEFYDLAVMASPSVTNDSCTARTTTRQSHADVDGLSLHSASLCRLRTKSPFHVFGNRLMLTLVRQEKPSLVFIFQACDSPIANTGRALHSMSIQKRGSPDQDQPTRSEDGAGSQSTSMIMQI